jgi:hypothetical protein
MREPRPSLTPCILARSVRITLLSSDKTEVVGFILHCCATFRGRSVGPPKPSSCPSSPSHPHFSYESTTQRGLAVHEASRHQSSRVFSVVVPARPWTVPEHRYRTTFSCAFFSQRDKWKMPAPTDDSRAFTLSIGYQCLGMW